MISLRAELPNKEDDYVQRNRRLVAKDQDAKYLRDIVRHGR